MAVTPPAQIALLKGAYSPEFIEPQKHYVAYPVTAGLQACLVEVELPNKAIQIFDALTILPRQVQHSTDDPDPVYACWLGMIASHYSVKIAAHKADPPIKALESKRAGEPPFLPPRQLALRFAAEALLDDGYGGQMRQPAEVAHSVWREFLSSIERAKCWYPVHWQTRDAREALEEQWRILAAWEHWEKAKLPWTERLRSHRENSPARVASAKPHRHAPASLKQLDAFQKRCRYLGLRLNNVNKAHGWRPFQPRRIVF